MKLKQLLLYLLLFLLPTQLGKHFFLHDSIINGVRIDYLSPTLYLTDLFILILSFYFLKNIKITVSKKIYLFLSLLVMNILFALSPFLAVYKLLKYFEIILLFFIISKSNLSSKNILATIMISTFFELIICIFQMAYGKSLQGIFYFFGERYFTLSTPGIAKVALQGKEILRAYGTFSHPNSLAGFYLFFYVFILFEKRFNKYPLLKYPAITFCTLLVFLSFSKITIILFCLITGIYLFKNLSCKLCLTGRILGLAIVSFIFLTAQGDGDSILKRISLIQDSIQIIIRHPFFGVGMGNYLIAQSLFPMKYSYYFLQPVHNIFLLFCAETGIPFFILTIYGLYNFFIKFIQKNKEIILPLLLVIFITGFFDHYWLTLQQNMLVLPMVFGLLKNQKWL